jgi:hypothetical protein
MFDVHTKRKAIVLIALIVVLFGAAAGFMAWGIEPDATAAIGSIG